MKYHNNCSRCSTSQNDWIHITFEQMLPCGAHIWIIPSGEESTPNIIRNKANSTKKSQALKREVYIFTTCFHIFWYLKEIPMTSCSSMPAVIRNVATVASSWPSRSMRRRRNCRAAPVAVKLPKLPTRLTSKLNSTCRDTSFTLLELLSLVDPPWATIIYHVHYLVVLLRFLNHFLTRVCCQDAGLECH